MEEGTRGNIEYYILLQFVKMSRTELYRFSQHNQWGTNTHVLSGSSARGCIYRALDFLHLNGAILCYANTLRPGEETAHANENNDWQYSENLVGVYNFSIH